VDRKDRRTTATAAASTSANNAEQNPQQDMAQVLVGEPPVVVPCKGTPGSSLDGGEKKHAESGSGKQENGVSSCSFADD